MDAFLDTHDAPEAPQAFKTYPELLAGMGSAERGLHDAKVAALDNEGTASLRTRLETATDPAMLWPIHQEFYRRGIPPIIRGPRHHHGLQGDFIDFAADLQWLWLTHMEHKPKHRLARAIFKALPGSPTWWELVKKLYEAKTNRSAKGAAISLDLDHDQRRHLRDIQTTTTRNLFCHLHGERFGELLDALHAEAAAKPDKRTTGERRTPTDIAARRAGIYRVHKLMDGSLRDTASMWQRLSGETPSLATIKKSVDLAETAFKRLRKEWAKEKKAEDVPSENYPITY